MRSISRKKFLTQISLSTVASFTFPKFAYPSSLYFTNKAIVEEYVEAEIIQGKIRGVRTDGVNIFRGIPYAGRISGDRRFRRPAPLEPWAGVRDALQLGAPAIQSPRRNEPAPAEDCLFLNVWTPANDNKKAAGNVL